MEENLLQNCRETGRYMKELLIQKLQSPNSPAAPYVFDIRGNGGFWGIEFDIPPEQDFGRNMRMRKRFGTLLQAKTMDKGLICIAMDGGADGVRGSHGIVSSRSPGRLPRYLMSRDSLPRPTTLPEKVLKRSSTFSLTVSRNL